MTALYQLTKEMVAVQELANDPDIPEQALIDTLEGIAGQFNEKAIRIVHVIANQAPIVAGIDAEIKRLQGRKKQFENAEKRLKEYLRENMEATGTKKIECDLFTITLAAGRDVVSVIETGELPDEYVRVKTTVDADKPKILAALKDGVEVPGAVLAKSKTSVRIK